MSIINILIVEDSPSDAALLARHLEKAGLSLHWVRVDNPDALKSSLAAHQWDAILCDFSLPDFTGVDALSLIRERDPIVPFIFVSGTMGEDVAVAAMKAGAQDYVTKGNLKRLAPALERELRDGEARRESRRSEELLQLRTRALEAAATSILIASRDGRIEWVNPAFTRLTGFTPQEAIDSTPRILKSGQHDDTLYKDLWKTICAGESWTGEMINRRRDGSLFYAETTITPVRSDSGEITHFIGIMTDVSEARRAALQIASREKWFRALIENASDVISVVDGGGVMRFQSPSFERVLGYSPTELIGRGCLEFVHPDDLLAAAEALQRAQANPNDLFLHEYRFRARDGSYRWMQSIGRRIYTDEHKNVIVINSRDVTEQKRLEDQLRQAQKMEGIGHLASGVAHDFNNILMVINGYSDILLHAPEISAESTEMLKQIYLAGERASNLTRQLLAFSRKQSARMEPLDLGVVVADIAKMLHRLIGERIHLEVSAQPALPRVIADCGMIEQALVNLAVNARDAMPDGGSLSISIETASISPIDPLPVAEARPGQFVCLTVRDTGSGISPEILEHIFEPFFTTKEAGKGTGLGLSTVFGIAKQHNGWVAVESQPGAGALFRIFLPADGAHPEGSRASPAQPRPEGGSETILLVEDEAPVRGLAAVVLQKFGYRVLEAENGEEALQVWDRHGPRIDLLLTDMVMPGALTGRQLAEKLLAVKPSLKVIYCSGYNSDAAGQLFDIRDKSPFLQKPYHPKKLAETVRSCFDQLNPA